MKRGRKTLIAPYDREFESKSLGSRAMTIFAGPLFNFIFGVLHIPCNWIATRCPDDMTRNYQVWVKR